MSTTADELFQAELTRRGLKYSIADDGQYEIALGEMDASVSLANIRRDFERDGDPAAIARFVEQLVRRQQPARPGWPEVKPLLRYSLEPSDYDVDFGEILHEGLTENLLKLFVFVSEDGSRISWIGTPHLTEWQVSRQEIMAQADANMDQLAGETTLEVDEIDGVKLGMLSTEETPFKGSLILSPRFREIVEPMLGWPVLAVVPVRDFVYVLARQNIEFLGRLGGVALREYQESGHPVTLEVLEVSDQGLKAIGTFADS
jgi:hypothetical protein